MCHASWGSSKHTGTHPIRKPQMSILHPADLDRLSPTVVNTKTGRTSTKQPPDHVVSSVLRHLRELAAGSRAFPHFRAMRRFPVLEETLIVERFFHFWRQIGLQNLGNQKSATQGGGKQVVSELEVSRGDFLSMEIITKVLRVHDPGCELSEIQRRSWHQVDRRSWPRLLPDFYWEVGILGGRRWFWMFGKRVCTMGPKSDSKYQA